MCSFITSNEPKDGSQQRDLNPAGKENNLPSFTLVLFPLFSVSVLLPPLLLKLGTESKRLPTCKYPTSELYYYPITSQLSTQSPLECYKVVDQW